MRRKRDPAADGFGFRPAGRATLGSYRVEQRHIAYHRRNFHFVSFEGPPGMIGMSAMWFLMNQGTRWEAVPQLMGEEPADTEGRLVAWLQRTIA